MTDLPLSVGRITQLEQRARVAGLTIADLFVAAGVHRTTWQRWRLGRSGPNLDQIAAVELAIARHERKIA